MNYSSTLNDFWGAIGTFFDIIPKLIYFLFAAFCSGVDVMQMLIRKLAGLDSYHQNGELISNTDPLTEFVYGILGVGDSAYVYKGLNTVFWSLAIFGLIVLVISTIVAIVKSHYNEDAESTNVWKYIYTAIKSILTFAVIPVVVVVGMQLSSFLLRTLDGITAGTTSEDAITGLYGTGAKDVFEGRSIEGKDYKIYGNYDYFGFEDPVASTTFSGMLFKASTSSANRARSGNISFANYQNIRTKDNLQIFGTPDCSAFTSLQTNDEKAEYIAMQIDYAFANNLQLQDGISWKHIVDTVDAPYAQISDLFLWGDGTTDDFSKWDVSLVWEFYNLWQFNFIVAFGAGVTIFGILISIVLGLMTRLVKGAALFLIYPALLGIAPLDNFKAFKQWGTNFMQQILMAFGAIIGLNLVLLILPYMQSLSFFNRPLIDAIINIIILIAALLMAKDFITMVNGFVGGADAIGAGDGVKSAGAAVKRGITTTGRGLATAGKVGLHVGKAIGRKPLSAIMKHRAEKKLAKGADSSQTRGSKKLTKEQKDISARISSYKMTRDVRMANKADWEDRYQQGLSSVSQDDMKKADKIKLKALREGASDETANAKREEYLKKAVFGEKDYAKYQRLNEGIKNDEEAIRKAQDEQADLDTKVAKKGLKKNSAGVYYRDDKQIQEEKSAYWKAVGRGEALVRDDNTGEYKKNADGTYQTKKVGGVLNDVANAGRSLADGFLKGLQDVGQAMGLDKLLGGAKDVTKDLLSTKWVKGGMGILGEAPKKYEGDALQREVDKKRTKEADAQLKATEGQTDAMKKLVEALEGQGTVLKKIDSGITNLNTNFTRNGRNSGNNGNNSGGNNP